MALVTMDKPENPGDGLLKLIRDKYPGYHPLMAIADLAHEDAVLLLPELRYKCHSTIARYIVPELKSVEVRATIEERRRVVVSLFGDGDVEDAVLIEESVAGALPAIAVGIGEGVTEYAEFTEEKWDELAA